MLNERWVGRKTIFPPRNFYNCFVPAYLVVRLNVLSLPRFILGHPFPHFSMCFDKALRILQKDLMKNEELL